MSPLISSNILGTYNMGSSSFTVLSFSLIILLLGFSRQEYWRGLPLPSPVDHILSDLSTMTHLSCVVHTTWLSSIELDKAVVHVIRLASLLWLWFQSVSPLMPSLGTYHLTWVSLTLDVGSILTAAPAKYIHCSLRWKSGNSSLLPPLTLDVGKFLSTAFLHCPCSHHFSAPPSQLWLAIIQQLILPDIVSVIVTDSYVC